MFLARLMRKLFEPTHNGHAAQLPQNCLEKPPQEQNL